MPTITFRLTRRQLVVQYLMGLVGVVLGFGVAAIAIGHATVGAALPVFVGCVVGSSILVRFRVTLSPDCFEVRRSGLRHIPWREIRFIDTKKSLGTTIVRVHFFNGAVVRLPAPQTSFLQPDPDFEAKLATITQWWMFYTGQLQPPAQTEDGSQPPTPWPTA